MLKIMSKIRHEAVVDELRSNHSREIEKIKTEHENKEKRIVDEKHYFKNELDKKDKKLKEVEEYIAKLETQLKGEEKKNKENIDKIDKQSKNIEEKIKKLREAGEIQAKNEKELIEFRSKEVVRKIAKDQLRNICFCRDKEGRLIVNSNMVTYSNTVNGKHVYELTYLI
ncbi:MAG: hypothetical protein RR835_03950 [Peptostreptococcaceae bacterium]